MLKFDIASKDAVGTIQKPQTDREAHESDLRSHLAASSDQREQRDV